MGETLCALLARRESERRLRRRASDERRSLAPTQSGLHGAPGTSGLHGLQRHHPGRELPAPTLLRGFPPVPGPAPSGLRHPVARADGAAMTDRARSALRR